MTDDKADAAARIIQEAEDPALWQGVGIGQRWYPRAGGAIPVYVSDLKNLHGRRYVTFTDGIGRPAGSLLLELFREKYQHR